MPIHSDPADFAKSPALQAGRRSVYGGSGTGSFLLDLPGAAITNKIRGPEAYQRASYDRVTRPLLNIDESLGQAARRHAPGFLKRMFEAEEAIPIAGKTIEGLPAQVVRQTARLTEPLMKMKGLLVPFLASSAFFSWRGRREEERKARELVERAIAEQQMMKGASDMNEALQKTATEELEHQVVQGAGLLKEASKRVAALDAQNAGLMEKVAGHEIRGKAEKLAWELVERGHTDPYADEQEFETKIASILKHGVEKIAAAIEMNIASDRMELEDEGYAGGSSGDPLLDFVTS